MTDFRNIFLDTSPIIYLLDKDINFGEKSRSIFEGFAENGCHFTTSAVTYEEYLIGPYKFMNMEKKAAFDKFIMYCGIRVISIDETVADKAAQIRAEYKSFKALDSMQLASAVISGCDMFFTNDKQLRQFYEIPVLTLDDF